MSIFAAANYQFADKTIYMRSNCIYDVSSIRECEAFTMESRGLSSLQLMEAAGTACSDRVAECLEGRYECSIFVFCGGGNNGGDGAVIARQLIFRHNLPNNVTVVHCVSDTSKVSGENSTNIKRWIELSANHTNAFYKSHESFDFSEIRDEDIVVDALFGIGLNKPLSGIHSDIVERINISKAMVVSIDIPSGLYADRHTPLNNRVVCADLTLTMQFMKLALLVPENFSRFGAVEVLDIGLEEPAGLIERASAWLVDGETFTDGWDVSTPFAHKGSFGHGLLVAGSTSMPGAAVLSAAAAMRGGIGKLTVHSTRQALSVLANSLPEAIHDIDDDEDCVSRISWNSLPNNINAVALGPGLGKNKRTYSAIKDILDTVSLPMVIDADALNFLSEHKTRLAFLPHNSILTPHFAEFERLAGRPENDFDRIRKARDFAVRHSVILVLKGHNTVVSMPDGRQFFNTTGNPGMATAGSGDVLTGLLLALLAQGYNPEFAALLGVFIHGAAGDEYASEHFYKTMIASDLHKYFSKAFNLLANKQS